MGPSINFCKRGVWIERHNERATHGPLSDPSDRQVFNHHPPGVSFVDAWLGQKFVEMTENRDSLTQSADCHFKSISRNISSFTGLAM